MTTTRERILQKLQASQRCTVAELAEAANINNISVRHHLSALQADGLISVEEERHGVGRPRQVYVLTEKGLERNPTRYLRLANRLLDQMKESLPEPVVKALFEQMANEMASDVAARAQNMTTEQRLDLIKSKLSEEGFSMEWEKQGEQYQIKEITCPYYHVGQTHPEVCMVDQTLISSVLNIPVEKVRCVLHGDAHCSYVIPEMSEEKQK